MLGSPLPSDCAVWRRTFTDLRDRFKEAADCFPAVRYVVLRALDTPGAIPKRYQRMFQEAGGYEIGEIRPQLEPHPHGLSQGLDPDFVALVTKSLAWDCAAEMGYLSGPKKGRSRFTALAKLAWLALPGTPAGKTQAGFRLNATECWWKVIHEKLTRNSGTYFTADELLVAEYRDAAGRQHEEEFAAKLVRQGDYVGVDYPKSESIPVGAKRWLVTELATDPFSASAVAIDMLLANPDSEGRVLISHEEMQAGMQSLAYQNENHRLDMLMLGGGRVFNIYRNDCIPVEGSQPTLCPNADRPRGKKDRQALLRYLPHIAEVYRKNRIITDGQTIHWTGRQASLGTICTCFRPKAARESRNKPGQPTGTSGAIRNATDLLGPRWSYWAIGLEAGKKWHLFRKIEGEWRQQRLVHGIANGRQATLLKAFAEGAPARPS